MEGYGREDDLTAASENVEILTVAENRGGNPQAGSDCPLQAKSRSIVSPVLLLGVEAPAVRPISTVPSGNQSRVTISSGPIGLWRIDWEPSMHAASSMW